MPFTPQFALQARNLHWKRFNWRYPYLYMIWQKVGSRTEWSWRWKAGRGILAPVQGWGDRSVSTVPWEGAGGACPGHRPPEGGEGSAAGNLLIISSVEKYVPVCQFLVVKWSDFRICGGLASSNASYKTETATVSALQKSVKTSTIFIVPFSSHTHHLFSGVKKDRNGQMPPSQ